MSSKQAFVQKMYRAGIDAGLTDAAARVMAAQAAIESSYGERAPGNNFFAITKGDSWNGPTITRTDKDANGNPIKQEFRSYPTPEAGIADRIAFMKTNFPGFSEATTMEAALGTLQNGVKGKYYEAPRSKYEATVNGINTKFLGGSQASAPSASIPKPSASIPTGAASVDYRPFLGGRQYGNPGGGVGVNSDKLDPEFSRRMTALMQAAENATGDKVSIFEGYRDPARSAQISADYKGVPVTYEGKTYQPTPGMKGKYLAAAPGVSLHNYGMATDIRAGAEPDKRPSGPAYEYMTKHAAEYGLQWLGSSDPAHFQIPQDEFKAFKAGTPLAPFNIPSAPLSVPLPRPRPGAVPSQMAQATSPPPIPSQAPAVPANAPDMVPTRNGQMYKVNDLVPSTDGTHKNLVQRGPDGFAQFIRQPNPGEIPGVFDPYKAIGENAKPSLIGDYINSHPEIAGPLQIAKGMGLTGPQAAQLAANPPTPPKIEAPTVAVNLGAGLGKMGNSLVQMFTGKTPNSSGSPDDRALPRPPVNVPTPSSPLPSYPVTRQNMGVTPPAMPPLLSVSPQRLTSAGIEPPPLTMGIPTKPAYGPGTVAPAGLPAARPPMAYTMSDLMGTSMARLPLPPGQIAPVLHPAPLPVMPRQIGTPPGTQLNLTTNAPRPAPPPVQMVQIASGRMVPSNLQGQRNGQGYAVQSDGSILHSGGWSTPGPSQPQKWWQINSAGGTV